jgi:dCTP deaminase
MIVNKTALLEAAPIVDMLNEKKRDANGVSYGLAEVGYDIRIKQDITFIPGITKLIRGHTMMTAPSIVIQEGTNEYADFQHTSFVLASTIEEFRMPHHLVGIVHDKSTWARLGLSLFNTVIEPGWDGYLTLELAFNGNQRVHIPAGSGIAQVIFHEILEDTEYTGSYQNQANEPVGSSLKQI